MAYDGLANVLTSPCRLSAAWTPESDSPEPPTFEMTAIWDTGATNSVIAQSCVDRCGLVASGMTVTHTAGGAIQVETYLVNIRLPNGVVFSGVRVAKGILHEVDMLIGMDMINLGDFSVTNAAGRTKFTFRQPSIEHIDYVEQHKALERAASRRTKYLR